MYLKEEIYHRQFVLLKIFQLYIIPDHVFERRNLSSLISNPFTDFTLLIFNNVCITKNIPTLYYSRSCI